ncbi:MAG: hypothetical protein ABIH41_00075 [Nanoarchaeota archaeon]
MNRILASLLKGFKRFGQHITTLINSILLSIVYILGVGITSLIARIAGKKFMDTSSRRKTTWTDLDIDKRATDSYFRQF